MPTLVGVHGDEQMDAARGDVLETFVHADHTGPPSDVVRRKEVRNVTLL